jgi:haloalkane dehalogenase
MDTSSKLARAFKPLRPPEKLRTPTLNKVSQTGMSNVRTLSPDHYLRPAWLTSELFPFQSRFLDVEGTRVHYVDEGSGPVLLFLHGAPNWSFFYRKFITGLRHDFRCIALDFPGFGLSPTDASYPPTMPALSRVVERFIDKLELRDIILVLGDAGGPIGLGAAGGHPEWFAGLVLAGTFGWSLKEYPKVLRMLRIVSSPPIGFLQEHFNVLMKYTAGTFPMSADERMAFLGPYVGATARRNPGALLGDLAGNDAFMNDVEQALQTGLNHLPVLLMWGDKDPVFEFLPRFQRIYPRARTLVIPGAHHFPFAEAPDEMSAEIRNWWTDVAANKSERMVS